jgi:hypothetical protein
MTKVRLDPQLQAIWDATPTSQRYILADVHHVDVRRGDRRILVPLAEVARQHPDLIKPAPR